MSSARTRRRRTTLTTFASNCAKPQRPCRRPSKNLRFLMTANTLTSQRVTHLYELMDSAYDADGLIAHSQKLNHVPIVAPNQRRGTRKASQLPKVFPVEPAPELTWAQQDRYKERTMIERVNA